jgi:hypothetical protein
VETILHSKKAFYGMIASGIDISDFELPKEQRKFELSIEANHAESIVGLIEIELSQGDLPHFNQTLAESYRLKGYQIPPPVLSKDQAQNIKELYDRLWKQWAELPYGEKLVLQFEE